MHILENLLNARIATLLDRMSPGWQVSGEVKGAFQGNQRQPDILVLPRGRHPVVIENEYVPADNVEEEARVRLGESLDAAVAHSSGQVNSVIALRSPTSLRDCAGQDAVDAMLTEGVSLEYALFTGGDPSEAKRFPKSGFIRGGIRDLAAFTVYASVPEHLVEEAVDILKAGVHATAHQLRWCVEESDTTLPEINRILKQPYVEETLRMEKTSREEQTLRMAATVMINALMFHENLAGQHGIKDLEALTDKWGLLLRSTVLEEWRKILKVNYWSIFNVARELLRNITPPEAAYHVLREMRYTTDKIMSLGVSRSHDLSGTVFQRLIADRKFLATFYTRPESAALLAHLAIPDGDQWADPERVREFRIADYACGTGTLIHAAYRRLNQLHWIAGGQPEKLHAYMMEHSLTACDVLPSAVHLTASMLSSSHPRQGYERTRTIVTQYGKTENGDASNVSLGSLDLLASNGGIRPLIPLHTGVAVTGKGEQQSLLDDVDMPPASQDLVIMNPPFTRAGSDWQSGNPQGYDTKTFHGLSTDAETQRKMAKLAKEYAKGTCAHGYAGIASWFVALADRMVKNNGTIALVLPMTVLQGATWQKTRELIVSEYSDVKALTIAAPRQHDRSFSAETGMAETLLLCRKSQDSSNGRGLFVSLLRRPRNEMEAVELARAISSVAEDRPNLRTLEDGPFAGSPLLVGEELLGDIIDAPLSKQLPWSAVGIMDFSVAQTVYQLTGGILWLPRMSEKDALPIPISTVHPAGKLGKGDAVIVGRQGKAAFDMINPPSGASTYPMLWSHRAYRENRMIVAPDSEGRARPGMQSNVDEIWNTRSHAHHNRDFQFNSQPLAVAFTETQTIGGRAWPNVKFEDRAQEVAYTLWGNTTPGLLCYWWHSSRQQAGRGSMPISAIRTMPTLDIAKLTPRQLAAAEEIFDDMRASQFLPANEAYRDNTRQELDYRVLVEMLGLPKTVLEPMDLLRLKWCLEPSVHGGKSTAPNNPMPEE